MMEKNTVFDMLGKCAALWCNADADGGDLARVTDFLNEKKLTDISVVPDSVATVWPWVENTQVKILARFYLPNKKVSEKQISDVTVRINNAFKRGAHGAQIFLPYVALGDLVEQTHVVRDDLFFNKDLVVGIDVDDIDVFEWDNLFEKLRKINASALMLVLTRDNGDRSDFVGRIYAMLNAWKNENKFDLHFAFGPNFMRIEQTIRLIESMQPGLINDARFFVNA